MHAHHHHHNHHHHHHHDHHRPIAFTPRTLCSDPLFSPRYLIAVDECQVALEVPWLLPHTRTHTHTRTQGSPILGSSYVSSCVRMYEDHLLFFKSRMDAKPW